MVAKKAGLSFDEINEFTLQDLADFVAIHTGSYQSETAREAQPDDIDAFYR